MLDEIMNIINQHGQQSVVENSAVPNEHNEGVLQEASSSILSELQQMVSGGNFSQLIGMFQGTDHTVTNDISNNFAQNISQKFGIDPSAATNIAGSLIPQVLGSLKSQIVTQGFGGMNMQNIFASLGNGGGVQDIINSVGNQFGLDKDKDGDVDLSDITGFFKK